MTHDLLELRDAALDGLAALKRRVRRLPGAVVAVAYLALLAVVVVALVIVLGRPSGG